MAFGRIRDYLLPGAAEADPKFRREVERLSRVGVRVIGAVEVFMPLLLGAAQFAMAQPAAPALVLWRVLLLSGVGVATLLSARTKWGHLRARPLALGSGWLSAAILVFTSVLMASEVPWADRYLPGLILTVLLVAIAAVPLRPMQTLAFGFSIEAFYLASVLAAPHLNLTPGAGLDAFQHAMIVVEVLLCTALTALIYAERVAQHRAHEEALRSFHDLCQARARAALSESAASLARLVAAFSHELNTPVGALTSAVDTLLVLCGRQPASPTERERLLTLQVDLRGSVRNSADRLRVIVGRMQRLTNLDKTEVQEANLNELLGDVAALLEPQARGRVRLELDFAPLPPITCRPQQLGAVFSNLLSNALDAIEADGAIVMSTRHIDSRAEIRIEDDGRGMDPEQLTAVFDPGFRMSGNRISTGHWSLFGARQVVREHGGEIAIASAKGKGTSVTVTLPVTRFG